MQLVLSAAVLAAVLTGCTTSAPQTTPADLEAARKALDRPLPGDPAVLYRLRLPSSGGLRLALLTSGGAGRMTVSEPFGSAVSVTAWAGGRDPVFYDLREGCRLVGSDLAMVLGVGAMPLPQAVRLLGGRLPALPEDAVSQADGRLVVTGRSWSAGVQVAPDPWRIVSVRQVAPSGSGWKLDLDDHTGSVPGRIRITRDGRWAELDLVRLEWNQGTELPEPPDLPACVVQGAP